MNSQQILDFWFSEIDPALWFKKDDNFDKLLSQRFGTVWQAGAKGELAEFPVRKNWLFYCNPTLLFNLRLNKPGAL
ncbi:DUF924 family protein [Yersinia ruckeri]|uniref:DUF924 family protein n=1 Tax=Yersinia ruckeri TaxID=29486 RepID=UPI0005E4FD34|nr:hypothetical protein UGYR_16000 [Yersinia ruckeri]EKN3345240.1 DUF924 family protein [Yersinia ruckeri]EKN3360659.1 DUF924 family protein [Yersinia ruckeri]EKN4183393.1 DUF924 family protein [Yersinia ruckeri]EKN4198385.1 DUF924 family protein [Yersinia ruckeri]